jgi:ABC-type dipeptide/oligopeptide/nickel transport system ATPase component
MPSPDYRNAGHGSEYGNFQGAPKLDLSVVAVDNGKQLTADMWIKSARNEGISVHVPSNNPFVAILRDQNREFSAYIPGLAGIPLTEEKRSKLIVQRLAAAGDANTVLRNVLDLLRLIIVGGDMGLALVERYVSRVMGGFNLEVNFEDDKHTNIIAIFQTADMRGADPKRFKPLELAGIGFLQVIQIFAYMVYFRPVILLVDEPDAHLHPTAQEKLVSVLSEAAMRFDTQVVLSTHSPSVVRALPPAARVIWMKDGDVHPNGNTEGRHLMGWGLLDKRILLMTEDTGSEMLRSLISQWPDIERITAIWPFHGTGKLPPPETIKGLHALLGGSLRIVIHRDRDFMMQDEVDAMALPYRNNGFEIWFTQYSDIEAYWTDEKMIEGHFGVDEVRSKEMLQKAFESANNNDVALSKRRKKRLDAMQKIEEIKKGKMKQYGDSEVESEARQYGFQYSVLGKDLVSSIRDVAQTEKIRGYTNFGKVIPTNVFGLIALDLLSVLNNRIS